MIELEDIARMCHSVNRAYCHAIGDDSQLIWELAPEWQQESARSDVKGIADGSIREPEDSHETWLVAKEADGWMFGIAKDPDKKLHPCILPFEQLPEYQRVKDHLFLAVVTSLLRHSDLVKREGGTAG